MIAGRVANLHALIPITFRLSGQREIKVEFVVDTGFTGFLTLPLAAIASMGLPFSHRIPADLADATTIDLDVYSATVVWNGVERLIPLLALGRRPLLGTALLENFDLLIEFIEDGVVHINGREAGERFVIR